MTTFGPTSGVTKTQLLDHIVSNMTADGHWSILHDHRNISRVPTASDFFPIAPKRLGETETSLSLAAPSASTSRRRPGTIVKHSGAFYLYYMQGASDAANPAPYISRGISTDGTTFSSGGSTTFNSNPYGFTISPIRMHDGNFWSFYMVRESATILRMYANGSADPPNPSSFPTPGGSSPYVDRPGNPDQAAMQFVGRAACLYESPTSLVVALPFTTIAGQTGVQFIRSVTTPDNFTVLAQLSEADLAGSDIHGVDYMVDRGTHIDVYVTIKEISSGELRTVRVEQSDTTWASPVFNTPSFAPVIAPGVLGARAHSTVLRGADGVTIEGRILGEFEGDDLFDASTLNPGDSQPYATAMFYESLQSGVDGNPDLNGIEYEYVILESSFSANNGEGYKILVAQVNPTQAAQPTVAGITDTLPIFARPIRGGDTSTEAIERFFLEPIIPASYDPTTEDAVGPAILSVPSVGASPEETHKVWMRVTNRQVFVFSESTNGTEQMLHINVPVPRFPLVETSEVNLRNDNISVVSAGVPAATAAVYLGRNGFDETSAYDSRLDNAPYYPLLSELTYSTGLTTVNAVDNKAYAFDIALGSNVSDMATAGASSLEFVVGSYVDAKYLADNSGLVTGDEPIIEGNVYKFFRPSNFSASNQAGMISPSIAIRWS